MNLTDLKVGERIKVTQAFKDFDGYLVPVGSVWTFKEYTYFAYDGGYSFSFNEGGFRLAELDSDNSAVLTGFSSFFEII